MQSFRNIRNDGIQFVANAAERLALLPTDGYMVEELDTHTVYVYSQPTNTWILVGGGSGGGNTYTGASPTTITVGGLPAGSAIAGETYTQILQSMLVPYIAPSFSSFSISGQSTTVEVGTTLSGSKSFAWGFNQLGNVTANTMSIIDSTTSTTLASGLSLTSPASANIGTIQLVAPGSHSWKGQATNSQSSTFNSSNFSVTWQWKLFYGTSSNTTLTALQIQALSNSNLAGGFAATYSFPGAAQYNYFCWPDSFGSPTTATGFKDTATNLAVSMADNTVPGWGSAFVQNGWYYLKVSVTNSLSQTTDYRVYRTYNQLGGAINIQVS
jgi:hypothetical protein